MWRKLAVTVVLISVMVIFVSMAGKRMIENSEVFAIAQRETFEGEVPILNALVIVPSIDGL